MSGVFIFFGGAIAGAAVAFAYAAYRLGGALDDVDRWRNG